MEKILTQLFDLPKMINSKLPMNNFNSMVEDSEHNVANWTGKFYTVSALVILLTSLMYLFYLQSGMATWVKVQQS